MEPYLRAELLQLLTKQVSALGFSFISVKLLNGCSDLSYIGMSLYCFSNPTINQCTLVSRRLSKFYLITLNGFSFLLPIFFSVTFQLCESLEELQNMNGKLRNEGQGIWALLGRIIGQVGWFFVSLYRKKQQNRFSKNRPFVSVCHFYGQINLFYLIRPRLYSEDNVSWLKYLDFCKPPTGNV